MASQTRVNGLAGDVGTLNGTSGAIVGASVKFYKILVKTAVPGAVDLQALDDAVGEAFERILRILPSGLLAYYAPADNTGTIYIAVDGHAAPVASSGDATKPGLQEMIRALGTAVGPDGGSTVDVSGTVVTLGTSFTVA